MSMSAEERRNLYNRVVREARLVQILLTKVNFQVDRNLFGLENAKLVYGGKTSYFKYDQESSSCSIGINWSVKMQSGKRSAVKCTANYDIIYDGFTVNNEEVLQIFADNVARAATYSYFRSLYASLDWAAELRSPPLPVLKLFPKV